MTDARYEPAADDSDHRPVLLARVAEGAHGRRASPSFIPHGRKAVLTSKGGFAHMPQRQACAGALVFDAGGRLLLVRRANPPAAGQWCEPSGRCRPGESAVDACVRECAEETGLLVRPVRFAGRVEISAGGITYDIEDYVCEVVGGSLRAGDDAAEVRWVDGAGFAALPLAPGVEEALTEWGCRPA
jgi:ADP-ribose pyrophosphatase YjhB (NUDIX family)